MAFDSFFSKKDKRIIEENRPFVDREEYIQAFKYALESIRAKERVLIYHGVAGIGKTSLRKELTKIIEEHNESHINSHILWVTVNFETNEFRQPHKFLEIMRDQFQDNSGIKFYTFDFAHALYWSKVNPRVPLYRGNYSEDSIVTQLLDIGDNLLSACIGFGPAKLISDIGRLVKRLPEKYHEWILKNKDEILTLINMEPSDIEKKLYLYWAYDLQEYLQKTSEAVVIFIDSYEALWGKDRSLAKLSSEDQWIRRLIQELLSSSCLWVLCGQEFPHWEDYFEIEKTSWENSIERYKIRGLPEKDARYLLESHNILEKDIQDTIIKGSMGVPYYLDLSIGTYKSIKEIKEPEPDDFAKVPEKVFGRFIKYLDENKEVAIKVLSVPNFWNRDIFNALIKEFTNYQSSISIIHSFSFIDEDEIEEGKWIMHQLMRQSWQEYQEKNESDERKSVHKFMLSYYVYKLENMDIKKITQEQKTALIEAFYHAKKILETEHLLNWFISTSDPFNRAALWQLLAPMYEEMLQILGAKLGSEHPDIATNLNILAELYREMGDYEKALPLYQRSLDIREKVLGQQHPDVATTLNNIALLYHQKGDYEKALSLYQKALDIREKVLGQQHPDVATTLNNIALLYHQKGDYEKALSLYQKALDIREKELDPDNTYVAETLNNIALLYDSIGDYEKALPLYHRALDIREKVLGQQHPDISATLNDLAAFYYQMGDYEKALPLYQRSLDIREKVLGQQHPDVATTLNNIALLYHQKGDYEKALSLYQKALDICEKVLGPQHPDVANSLTNLAGLYRQMGNYKKALQLYQRALDIYEKTLDPHHPDVANSINSLAALYFHMGDYDTALPLFKQALSIREKVLGPQHPDIASSINNIAVIYSYKGAYEKALPLYQRALNIREKALGSQHPFVATTLNNLAGLYRHMGDYEKALLLYQRSLDIREKVLGSEHPSVATTLNNLAALYRQMGDYEKALLLYQRSLDIREKVLGPQHPDVSKTLNNLAELYESMGENDKSLSIYQRISKSSNKPRQ